MTEQEDSVEIQLNRILGEFVLVNKYLKEIVAILQAMEAKQK